MTNISRNSVNKNNFVVKLTKQSEWLFRRCSAIRKHKDQPGAMMPVLQEAQGIYGYLPREVQEIIAQEMNVPLSQVFGVATFYSQFTLTPKGEHTVSVCLGTACYVKGADKILAAIEDRLGIKAGECTPDGFFSIDSCRCLGACGSYYEEV